MRAHPTISAFDTILVCTATAVMILLADVIP